MNKNLVIYITLNFKPINPRLVNSFNAGNFSIRIDRIESRDVCLHRDLQVNRSDSYMIAPG
jgi:hypothetical protein